MKTKTFTIAVADIALGITVDEWFYEEASAAFLHYASDLPVRFMITVSVANTLKVDPSFPQGITVRHNILTGISDEYFGTIDLAKGKGNVTIGRTWAMNALANFLKNVVSYLVLSHGGLMLHSAGLVRDNEAYVFFGPSGIGKSTVAKVSTDCMILSDELIAVRPSSQGYRAYGTPSWSEDIAYEKRAANRGVPLKALFKLVQDTNVYIKELPYGHALADILTVPHYVNKGQDMEKIMQSFCSLVLKVPCYELHFLPDNSLWRCIDDSVTVCA
jgi:hypothetical protein